MQCDEARPACSMCVVEGSACVYTSAKPRQSKAAEPAPGTLTETPLQETQGVSVDELDDLGSPGFHNPAANQPIHHLTSGQPVDEHVQDHFSGHLHQSAIAPVPEPIPHQLEQPADAYDHSIYQHSSGLSFPHVSTGTTAELSQPGITSSTLETAPVGYIPNQVSDESGTSLPDYTYCQPPASHKTSLTYTEQSGSAAGHDRRGRSGGQTSTARRSLPSGQISYGSGTSGNTLNT